MLDGPAQINETRSIDALETSLAEAIGITPATWIALRDEALPFDAFLAEAIGLITGIDNDNVTQVFPDAADEIEYPHASPREFSPEALERWRRRTGQQE